MPRAFISYSRDDSDFVLRMATDLRERGVPIWLDQLDIPPGDPWDEAVEAALEEASHFLFVMTPSSVSSSPVRDELAYAIDEGMRIIPILLQDCKIPLRVRRIQWTDFREAYDQPLAQLVSALPREWEPASLPPAPALAADAPPPLAERAAGVSKKAREKEEKGPPQVYVNYDDLDYEVAYQLALDLNARGITTYLDIFESDPATEIERAIRDASVMLVVLSPAAFESEWVLRELQYAEALDKPVVPVVYQPADPPAWFSLRYGQQQLIDFSQGNRDDNLAELARQLADRS